MSELITTILTLWALVIFGAVITLFLLRLRNVGKTTVVMLKPTRTYKTGSVKTDGDKLKVKDGYQPNFTPLSIFQEEKSPMIFWRSAKRLIFLVENSNKALSFPLTLEGELEPTDLMYHWTPHEIREYVKKLAKKAAVETKPMSQSMFIILLILTAGSMMLTLLMAMRLGVF